MASVGDIADLIGLTRDEVAFLDEASATQRAALAGAVEQAGRDRDTELARAVDKALGFIPRPLRGRVVKMIGAGAGGGRRG